MEDGNDRVPFRDGNAHWQQRAGPRPRDLRRARYLLRTGCAWRRIAFRYFRTWRSDGTWERVHESLRE